MAVESFTFGEFNNRGSGGIQGRLVEADHGGVTHEGLHAQRPAKAR